MCKKIIKLSMTDKIEFTIDDKTLITDRPTCENATDILKMLIFALGELQRERNFINSITPPLGIETK